MRIDKVLWYLRLVKSRKLAQELAEAGHIRVNGRRIERAHQNIGIGDILTIPLVSGVRVIELTTVPIRRGPAPEAQGCYRVLDESGTHPIPAPIRTVDSIPKE